MFNLGLSEIIVIAIVLIIVVGPERLPQVMKKVGGALRTVRQASREIQTTVGLDELWREDVMAPPPTRPRVPPTATVSRQAELGPSAAAAASAAEPAAPASTTPAASTTTAASASSNDGSATASAAAPAPSTPAAPAPAASPAPLAAPASGDIKGES